METFAFRGHSLSRFIHGMRASLVLALLAFCPFMGAAHAMSCMIHEIENRALLCYHKSADGRCIKFGPACETTVTDQPTTTLATTPATAPENPVTTVSSAADLKK